MIVMLTNPLIQLSSRQLNQAAAIRQRIEELEKALVSVLGAAVGVSPAASDEAPARRTKRRFGAATRAKMAAAMKARWAARKATAKPVAKAPAPTKKVKRTFSAAGRAKLAASARARWKKAKAAGKATL